MTELHIPERIKTFSEMPIRSEDIPNFRQWVNWNPFSEDHKGIDLALYQSTDGEYQLGLPIGTPVRAVIDGVVVANDLPDVISGRETQLRAFYRTVVIQHYENFATQYAHLMSDLPAGVSVKAGEVIGTLVGYSPSSNTGKITHLHFSCGYFSGRQQRKSELDSYFNPQMVMPQKIVLATTPQHAFGIVTLIPTGERIHPKVQFAYLLR